MPLHGLSFGCPDVQGHGGTLGRGGALVSQRTVARPPLARATWLAPSAFRFVIAGSSVSMLGTKISTLAFPLLVLWLGGSPVFAGFAICVTIMPGLLLHFPAGIIVDKANPWDVMIYCEIFRGLVAISIAIELLECGRHTNIEFLIAAMFLEEALEMFTTLAERRYLNRLMPPEDTTERRSKQASIEARTHTAVLAGRPVAPFLFMLSPLLPFLADAISFAFSVTGLLLSREKSGNRHPLALRQPEPRWQSGGIGDAFKTVRQDNHIWLSGLLMAMTSLVAQALILIFLTEANSHHFSAATIGMVLAASGLGGAVGSYCSKPVLASPAIRRCWIPIQMAAWFTTCSALALAGGRSAWWSGWTMFVFSVTGAIGNVKFSTYLNINVEDNMLGKISGIGYATSIGACAFGPVIGGYFAQRYSIQGAVTLLLGIVALMTVFSLPLLRDAPGKRPAQHGTPARLTAKPGSARHRARKFTLPIKKSTTVDNSLLALYLRIEGVTFFVLATVAAIVAWRSSF